MNRLMGDLADSVERLVDVIEHNTYWHNDKLDPQDQIVRDKHMAVAKGVLQRYKDR